MGRPAWLLALSCHASIASFFAYETAGALAPQLLDEFGFTEVDIGLMYSAWSIPGIITIFIGGILADKWGASKTLCLSSMLAASGTIIVAMSSTFWPMFIGNMIFGMGGSTCYSTTSTLMGVWFLGDASIAKKLAISHGLSKMWLRGGSFTAFIVLPVIAARAGLRFAMWFSAIISLSGAIASVIFLVFEASYFRFEEADKKSSFVNLDEMSEVKESDGQGVTVKICQDDTVPQEEDNMSTNNSSVVIVDYDDELAPRDSDDGDELAPRGGDEPSQRVNVDEKKSIRSKIKYESWIESARQFLQQFKEYPRSYWVIFALVAIFITDLYSFTAFFTNITYDEFGYSMSRSAFITSLVCLANLTTSPFSGLLFGYIGRRTLAIIGGSLTLLFVHFCFAVTTKVHPAFLAVLLGLTQSILDTNLWPALPLILNPKYLGMGYAFSQAVYSITLFGFPLLCGAIKDSSGSWQHVQFMFVAMGIAATVCAFLLNYINRVDNGPLEFSNTEARKRQGLTENGVTPAGGH